MAIAKNNRPAVSNPFILFAPLKTTCTASEESYYEPLFRPLIALLALHQTPNPRRPALFAHHPLAHHPRRIMPNMLPMPALQPRRPMPHIILIKTHHRPLHHTPSSNIH